MSATIVGVARSARHRFSKDPVDVITLVEGVGVEGDAHAGTTVKHRSRVAKNPNQPNLRQVHLIHSELLDDLNRRGFPIVAGALGENVTTQGIDLLSLPAGTKLHLGPAAIVELTGLRNPCVQIENFHEGLLPAVIDRDGHGHVVRKAGVMSVVRRGGAVRPGDAVLIELPPEPHRPLEVV